jgi:hypothetical protein
MSLHSNIPHNSYLTPRIRFQCAIPRQVERKLLCHGVYLDSGCDGLGPTPVRLTLLAWVALSHAGTLQAVAK